jgi:hypothetical protein
VIQALVLDCHEMDWNFLMETGYEKCNVTGLPDCCETPCHPNRDSDYAANITKFPTIQLNLSTLKVSPYPVYGLINLSPDPKQQQTFSIE